MQEHSRTALAVSAAVLARDAQRLAGEIAAQDVGMSRRDVDGRDSEVPESGYDRKA
jgi:hypothetical protein